MGKKNQSKRFDFEIGLSTFIWAEAETVEEAKGMVKGALRTSMPNWRFNFIRQRSLPGVKERNGKAEK